MSESHTIVLKDNSLLSEIFGANDTNIRIFENLLGVSLHLKGNEILLDTANTEIFERLKKILKQLEDHIRLGHIVNPDLLKSIHESVNHHDPERINYLKKQHVIIPNARQKVFPRSFKQAQYLEFMEKNDMVFSIGPAGTGKTYLAVAQALKMVLSKTKRKLILTRPVVEADESLGFLPGTLEEKIQPYLRPIYDAMEAVLSYEMIQKLITNGVIEVAPLAYMRGRTLSDCFVILDEAQNTTKKQMLMFLTRIGEGSKAVITGDVTQIDLPRKSESGLLHVIEVLKPIDEIKFIHFTKDEVVRNPLVRKIVQAYETVQ